MRLRPAPSPAQTRSLPRCPVAGLLLALLLAAPAVAGTRLEGYYEAELAAQKDNNRWHFGPPGDNGMPTHFAELKFWSNPSDRFEIYSRLWARSNRDDDRTSEMDYYHPRWIDGEGHLKLRQVKYEAILFYRQNHFYINDEPLLRLVEDYKLKNDDWGPKAQGIRFDFWDGALFGVRNLGGTVIVSDNGGTYSDNRGTADAADDVDVTNGDNALIMRGRHKSWDGRIVTGVMFLRKDWTDTSLDNWRELTSLMHNDVFSADISFTPRSRGGRGLALGPLNLEQSRWTAEFALSRRPYSEVVSNASKHNAYAMAFEARDLHFSSPLTINAWYRDIGENFRDYMSGWYDQGGDGYNRVQKHIESIWLVPRKAVTAKLIWDDYRKQVPDEPGGGLRPATDWYGELYMEFIQGFKARFAYKRWHGYDESLEVSDFATYPDWFGEVSVENFLAKIRLQARIHDAGTFRQVTAIGFDMNVNITDHLKGYLRALNVNEETQARNTMFAQLKYDIGSGAELYFEYGDAGQSDNLAYTDWFVNESSGDNLRDRFKLLLRAWY